MNREIKEFIKKNEKKINSEDKLRKYHLDLARQYGFEDELRSIWNRYDNLIKNCKNEQEHEQLAIMGLSELHKLLGCVAPLVVNDREIIPARYPEKSDSGE